MRGRMSRHVGVDDLLAADARELAVL